MDTMIYFGFDLGDGESCITYIKGKSGMPTAIPVTGKISFLSAVGKLDDHTVVGDYAVDPRAEDSRICFKRHFRDRDADSRNAIRAFAAGVLEDIRNSNIPGISNVLDDPAKVCFKVGCPAGWTEEERNEYKELLESTGLKNVKITSESRAAFEHFARSSELSEEERKLFNQSVLVIDIGSSTLDFSYVKDGNEFEVEIMGNTLLGGGMMDEMLLLNSTEQISDRAARENLLEALRENGSVKSKLMHKTRQMKEDYFTHEEEYLMENREYRQSAVAVANGKVLKFNLVISPEIVENYVKSYPHPLLNNQTFEARLRTSLAMCHQNLRNSHAEPQLVILTGGPSRMSFFREACENEFPKAKFLQSMSPETDISEGLAYLGSQDDETGRYIREVQEYAQGTAVEEIVNESLCGLTQAGSEAITDVLYDTCILPNVQKWKNGELATLNDMQEIIVQEIPETIGTETMQEKIGEKTKVWEEKVVDLVQADLDTMAQKYNFRTRPLDLKGFLYRICGEIRNPIEVDPLKLLSFVVDLLIAAVAAAICGGGGTALIMSGPVGLAIGAALSLIVTHFAKGAVVEKVKERVMNWNIPQRLRFAFPVQSIGNQKNRDALRNSLQQSMEQNWDFRQNLVNQITENINRNVQDFVQKSELML